MQADHQRRRRERIRTRQPVEVDHRVLVFGVVELEYLGDVATLVAVSTELVIDVDTTLRTVNGDAQFDERDLRAGGDRHGQPGAVEEGLAAVTVDTDDAQVAGNQRRVAGRCNDRQGRADFDDSAGAHTFHLHAPGMPGKNVADDHRVFESQVLAALDLRVDQRIAVLARPARTPGRRPERRRDGQVGNVVGDRLTGRRRENTRNIQTAAAVVEKCARCVRQVGSALAGRQVERRQTAIDALEFGVGRDQARLGRRRPGRVLHRPEAGHAGKTGGTGRHAFDRLGAEADLLDIDARC